MKHRIALVMVAAALLMTFNVMAADNNKPAGTYGEERAKMVNNYVNKVLQPLFTCFATNYNSGRAMTDPDQSEKISKNIRMCRTMSTTTFAPPPDGTAAQLRSDMLNLISKLEQKLSQLESTLRMQQKAKRTSVRTGKLYGGKGAKEYTSRQQGVEAVSLRDPRKRFDKDVQGTRNALINLGTDYEKLQKRMTAWIKQVQDQINAGAKARQQ